MLVGARQSHVPSGAKRAFFAIDNGRFFAIAVALETLVIVATSVVAGVLYHIAAYGDVGQVRDFAAVGTLTALLFTLPFIIHGQYSIEAYLGGKRGVARLFNSWSYAFLSLAVLGFLTKTTVMMSRGWMLTFFVAGLLAVVLFDALLERWLTTGIEAGWVAVRRLMLIGTARDIERFKREHAARPCGSEVVTTALLPEHAAADELSEAELRGTLAIPVDFARKREVSDIVVLVGLQYDGLIGRVADCCMDLPAAIHLGRLDAVSRFPGLRIERLGTFTTLALVRSPMSTVQLLCKRLFDLGAACVGLALLAPVLLLAAVAIKLDSPGPVFFRQRRRGFNHKEFRIWKFRTMTTMDDGDRVVQARPGDARVTRVGRILRRTNIDELPQLFNVIRGQMSLVGPRPHAIAHDKHFERCIQRYARRLNVKPGITGWAQIKGLRGPTDTDAAMRDRVECDLYYIDNWSLMLDVYIIMMTVVSRRAYRNAH